MVLHLVQVALFWREHGVNLEEQRWKITALPQQRTAQVTGDGSCVLCGPPGTKIYLVSNGHCAQRTRAGGKDTGGGGGGKEGGQRGC